MIRREFSSLVLAVAILAGRAEASDSAVFDCVLDPALSLKLGSPVASIIEKIEVDRGDLVIQGQVVARLESAIEAATVALGRAKAESTAEISAKQVRLQLTRLAYGRQTTLQERNVAATPESHRARAEHHMA